MCAEALAKVFTHSYWIFFLRGHSYWIIIAKRQKDEEEL
jgi:hypothetical protein